MQVIIPHPTELKSLTKLQKQLIKENFSSDCLLTRQLPIWIDIDSSIQNELSKMELKDFSNTITKIELSSPELSSNKNSIFCPVTVFLNNQIIKSKLELVRIHTPSKFILKKISTEEINFPLCLKIFRIGTKIELPEQNAQAIQDSVWKKL